MTDDQQKVKVLAAAAHGEDGEREAEQRDEIEMQACQPEAAENQEAMEDRKQLLTDTNRYNNNNIIDLTKL